MQALAPALANVPFSHTLQAADPTLSWNCPGGHCVQEACPLTDWNFPTPDGEQGTCGESDAWNVPGLQGLHEGSSYVPNPYPGKHLNVGWGEPPTILELWLVPSTFRVMSH